MTREQLRQANDLVSQIDELKRKLEALGEAQEVTFNNQRDGHCNCIVNIPLLNQADYQEGNLSPTDRWALTAKNNLEAILKAEIKRLEEELATL